MTSRNARHAIYHEDVESHQYKKGASGLIGAMKDKDANLKFGGLRRKHAKPTIAAISRPKLTSNHHE